MKVWDQKQKRFSDEATIDSPMPSDDGAARSYKIITDAGRLRHVTAAWLVKAAAEQNQ